MEGNTLRKDSVGMGMVIAQSLTTVAPLMDLIAFITTAALFAYGALPLAFLLAFAATFLSINTIFQFSKKLPAVAATIRSLERGSVRGRGFSRVGFTLFTHGSSCQTRRCSLVHSFSRLPFNC